MLLSAPTQMISTLARCCIPLKDDSCEYITGDALLISASSDVYNVEDADWHKRCSAFRKQVIHMRDVHLGVETGW